MRDIFGAPSHNVLVKTCRISTLQNSWDWVVEFWPLKIDLSKNYFFLHEVTNIELFMLILSIKRFKYLLSPKNSCECCFSIDKKQPKLLYFKVVLSLKGLEDQNRSTEQDFSHWIHLKYFLMIPFFFINLIKFNLKAQ